MIPELAQITEPIQVNIHVAVYLYGELFVTSTAFPFADGIGLEDISLTLPGLQVTSLTSPGITDVSLSSAGLFDVELES